jgi:peptidoglycan/LPS O-acetylase OafA/YrhL
MPLEPVSKTTTRPLDRLQAVDVLRAFAVLLVLGRHMTPAPKAGLTLGPFVSDATAIWARGGWVGVDLFFVLSGFLVSGLLFREYRERGAVSGRSFLLRRGFKIYPAFWVLIAGTVVVSLFLHNFSWKGTVAELLFLQSYYYGLWSHTWSLAVEEHFYLILLLFIMFLSRRAGPNPFRHVPLVFGLLALSSVLLRLRVASSAPYSHGTHLFPSHLRMDSLFFGVLISYFYHYYNPTFLSLAQRYRVPMIGCGALALSPAFMLPLETTAWISTFGLCLFYVGSGSMLMGSLGISTVNHFFPRSIAYIGAHSYSIYLWHLPLSAWILPATRSTLGLYWNWYIYVGLYIVGSVVFGVLMAWMVERPALRVRDRWFPSRSKSFATSGLGAEVRRGDGLGMLRDVSLSRTEPAERGDAPTAEDGSPTSVALT